MHVRQVPAGSERLVAPAFGSVFFTVRTSPDPTSIVSDVRDLVRHLDPQATLDGVTTWKNAFQMPSLARVFTRCWSGFSPPWRCYWSPLEFMASSPIQCRSA